MVRARRRSRRPDPHVGQACDIARRHADHARDHEAAYPNALTRPALHCVWAAVNVLLRDDVEAYMGKRPCPAGTYADVVPVPVMLPLVRWESGAQRRTKGRKQNGRSFE